jgi:ribosomal protein S12 methylthiotransferase
MEVIEIMAKNPKVCKYLDIPVQHISERILTSMNRGHGREKLENLLTELRERVPDVAIRTTLLVGYPGETEAEFDELYLFAKDFKFDRLGVFPYSHEDDTPAAILKDDIAQELKEDRVSRIMEMQQEVSLKLNENKVGKVFDTIIDREEEDFFVGRTEFDSPEVDNEVLVEKNSNISIGSFYPIRITSADEFDLFGKIDQ